MSSYFTLPSFARAKKNQEELQKTNPTQPLLKEEDEKFLERHMSQDEGPKPVLPPRPAAEVAKITDEGDVKEKKQASLELPSQEEAEALTRGWNSAEKLDGEKEKDKTKTKTTWASYWPAKLQPAKTEANLQQKDTTTDAAGNQRTWGEYASNLLLSNSLPSWPDSWTWSKDKDAKPEPVYNEDGSINEEKTREKEEKEVSVLLDNLNMSAINNRVFAFNQETQKFYDRFAQVLKDTINGVPTAYDDMDKLMRDAGPTLEKQFKTMPPFVQTLVKSLPAKIGTTLAPEIMAAASVKPGADMQAKMAAEGSSSSSKPENKKKKRTIPGLKKLMSKEGVVATMLRNTVTFLTTRFPFLASATNIVLSLAVFILMFVFWYCHKRGKEVRLANESASSSQIIEEEDGDIEVSASDNDDDATQAQLAKALSQPDPVQVPLPRTESELEEKK